MYDKELYVIIKAWNQYSRYLKTIPRVLYFDYQALKLLNGKLKLNARHPKHIEFFYAFLY